MKKVVFAAIALAVSAATASAADLAPRYTKAPPMPIALYNWSGCYIGGHAGGTWSHTDLNIPAYVFPNSTGDTSGFSGGALGGCQYMTDSRIVFGIEGDYTWMDQDNTHLSGNGGTELFHTHYDQAASIRGRLGYSPMMAPNVLLYVTGGGTWANLSQANYIPLAAGYRSAWNDGWIVGVGVEYAFASNVIVGVEYLHAEYNDTQNFVFLGPTNVKLKDSDTVRARLSYKFDWFGAPLVAKY